MVDAITGANLHIIVTMRSKMEYVQATDDRGRTVVRKVGMQPVQREGLELSNPAELTMAQLHELRAWMIEEARAAAELEEATLRVPAEDVLQCYDADPDSDSLARLRMALWKWSYVILVSALPTF